MVGSYKDEVIRAMEMLGQDEKVVFVGQTVKYKGSAIFGSLGNVADEKKIELPIMEDNQMGISIGLSLQGFIPVSVYPRFDFLICAMNQMVNHLDKIKEMSDGEFKPKVIIRTQVGGTSPLYPGVQHCSDYTLGFKEIFKEIDVVKLERAEDVFPAYLRALESDKSTLLIEVGDLYNSEIKKEDLYESNEGLEEDGEGLDVLFVNPGSIKKKIYQDLSKDFSAVEPPFWAGLSAGFLRGRGKKVNILDCNAENLSVEESADKIVGRGAKIVNIVVYGQHPSASTQLMNSVEELCKEIKKRDSGLKIILSGIHVSALPERTLREIDCDYVCEGEGFYTLLGLVNGDSLLDIPGLWYFSGENVLHNGVAPIVKDLDSELSDVAWDLLPMNKYKAHNWHCLHDLNSRKSYASISTSLGCPFNCSFCCINAPFGKPSYRTWSVEWVLKQLDILVKEYGIKNIKFIDELFILKPEHFLAIANGIIERGYDLNIWVYARIDTVNKDDLPILKKAGFNWFALGIESGDEEVRKSVSKGRFLEGDIREVVRAVQSAGINVIGNYIFGLPEDDLESMKKTLDLAKELNCEFANFYCATAYPGSRLYLEALEKNLELPEKWEDYAQHSYGFFPLATKYLSSAEVLKFRDKGFDDYFSNEKYLEMIENRFGIEARRHLEEMTKLKLKRKVLGD